MHGLIVMSHPLSDSLTDAVARQVAAGLEQSGHSFELADLSAEGFDPRFSANDVAVHLRQAVADPAVAAEQVRIGRADALVLVYPVYWWSFPALLKGWIDRVFVNGWGYDEREDGSIAKLLGRLKVRIVGVGGAGPDLYARRGYDVAMRTQIEHGIFDYCGAPVLGADYLLPTDAPFPDSALQRAEAIGREIARTRETVAA